MKATRFGRRTAWSLAALALFSLFGSGAGRALAGSFGNNVGQAARYTGQKAADGADYLDQQFSTDVTTAKQMATSPASIPAIQASPSDLASEARANIHNTASATSAAASDVMARAGGAYNAATPGAPGRYTATDRAAENSAAASAAAAEMSK